MTPAAHDLSLGSQSNPPTNPSEPRGSLTTAERKRSCCSRKTFICSATVPPPRSGPPPMTTRVGSPPVWESMIWTFFVLIMGARHLGGNAHGVGLFWKSLAGSSRCYTALTITLSMNRPSHREILDCASPLALSHPARGRNSDRGLPQSKTLARQRPFSRGSWSQCMRKNHRKLSTNGHQVFDCASPLALLAAPPGQA